MCGGNEIFCRGNERIMSWERDLIISINLSIIINN